MTDDRTMRFYAENAATYATRTGGKLEDELQAFLSRLRPAARILELGTGSGADAANMLARGFDVHPTDASPELAAQAERRIGRPVRIMRFDELAEQDGYDGIWANACLLHAPRAELTSDIARIHSALRPGGIFVASFKAGNGEGRDQFGRYYNYPDRTTLEAHCRSAASWRALEIIERQGGGYDDRPTPWLWVIAEKAA